MPLVSAQSGARTTPVGLDQLVQRASVILRGSVISANVEPHPQFSNLQTVVVTISVGKVLKGEPGKLYTFRQFLMDPRDAADAGGYRKSGELLLFLNPTSEYGLTSPVGLEQGRFRITRDAKGRAFTANGQANLALFDQVLSRGTSRGARFSAQSKAMISAPSRGKVPLEPFEDAVVALARLDP
ncbi:MAG TPA: hypothetical protein VIM00_02740 [Candidatus Acidoferrum sp.]